MKKCNGMSNLDIVKSYLSGERPFIQVGYEPKKEKKHKDGSIWKDKNGKEWMQIGSSKISKILYDTKESTRQLCSSCKKDIYWAGNNYDEKFFNRTGKCYDCVIEEETKMRQNGTFETYEKIKVINNQKAFLTELQQKITESVIWLKNKSNKIEYINEDGTKEFWTDVSRDEFLEDAYKDLSEINKSIILCEQSILMLEDVVKKVELSNKNSK
jgi:hypothetical protein